MPNKKPLNCSEHFRPWRDRRRCIVLYRFFRMRLRKCEVFCFVDLEVDVAISTLITQIPVLFRLSRDLSKPRLNMHGSDGAGKSPYLLNLQPIANTINLESFLGLQNLEHLQLLGATWNIWTTSQALVFLGIRIYGFANIPIFVLQNSLWITKPWYAHNFLEQIGIFGPLAKNIYTLF